MKKNIEAVFKWIKNIQQSIARDYKQANHAFCSILWDLFACLSFSASFLLLLQSAYPVSLLIKELLSGRHY